MNGVASKLKLLALATVGAGVLGLATMLVPAAAKSVQAGPATATAEPRTPKGERTIAGRVLGADGQPVAADLALVWADAEPQPLGRTQMDGTFRVTLPLMRNEYGGWLVATAAGHGPDFCPHGHDDLPQSLAPAANVTLRLPKERPINGRVLDQQGKPVAGAVITVRSVHTYESAAAADRKLREWAGAVGSFAVAPPPQGDREVWYHNFPGRIVDAVRTPYTATTDQDGRFTLTGIGAGQLVVAKIRGPGIADGRLLILNREGYDPKPVNQLLRAGEGGEVRVIHAGSHWVLLGPAPDVVVPPERLIRGTVVGPDGKPRAGIRVTFTQAGERQRNPYYNSAVTGADGRYEIRGAAKYQGYTVESAADPATGLLPARGSAADTPGYEPITIDLKAAQGVVVTGTVRDKATGRPVPARLQLAVWTNNPFAKDYPAVHDDAVVASDALQTDAEGKFRVVTIPGPVLLAASPRSAEDRLTFKAATPDPKLPGAFSALAGPDGGMLMFFVPGGGLMPVQGNGCRVVDAKKPGDEVAVNIDLEPAAKTLVKVVDADGKAVAGAKCVGAASLQLGAQLLPQDSDTITVYGVDPKQGRLLAVVHEGRKLVGTLALAGNDRDPVVKLGPGGAVSGRAVDGDGKPLAGLEVKLWFARPETTAAFEALRAADPTTTGADGTFRLGGVFPGQEFQLLFTKGPALVGPNLDTAPKRTAGKHGEVLELGDLKLEPGQ